MEDNKDHTMSLQLVCSFVNSLSTIVDSLHISQTKQFSHRWDEPEGTEESIDESFSNFVSTIKSIHCQTSNGNVIVEMR